jgi:hypothetical protein
MTKIVRIGLNLSQDQLDSVKKVAEDRGVTMTDVIRNALALDQYLQNAVADGKVITLEDRDGKNRRELVFLFSTYPFG